MACLVRKAHLLGRYCSLKLAGGPGNRFGIAAFEIQSVSYMPGEDPCSLESASSRWDLWELAAHSSRTVWSIDASCKKSNVGTTGGQLSIRDFLIRRLASWLVERVGAFVDRLRWLR